MLLSLWTNYWEDWLLYHKCIFDGENKLIIISPNATNIDIKRDIYSAWKQWVMLRDFSKYDPAIRNIGGDPIGGGKFAGDLYFLINSWKVFVDHSVFFDGILFSDDGQPPIITSPDTYFVQSTVSNLAQSIQTSGSDFTVQDIWKYNLGRDEAGNIVAKTERKVDDVTALIFAK